MPTKIDPRRQRDMLARLARVEGQIRGVQRLVESQADCEKIAQQLSAARKALDKSFFSMVACLMESEAMPADDVAALLTKYS